MTGSLASDGQTTATGNLKMGNNRITGLADGIASTDAASLNQVTNAVAITGGTINGTSVGATTAATGRFTTLEATGVTTVQAGTAAAPAITTTGDTNTGIFFPAADTIAFAEGGTESMRIDGSGNVGIGTASPTTKLDVSGQARFSSGATASAAILTSTNAGGTAFNIQNSGTVNSLLGGYNSIVGSGNATDVMLSATQGVLAFGTGASSAERMRIDSSGRLLVGSTATTSGGNTISAGGINITASANFGMGINMPSGNQFAVVFANGGTGVGSIATTVTATAYNTSSDYRLKENIAPMQNALATVAQLKPVTYKWKVDGSDGQGFIAHELQAIVPDCVSGEKDAVETYTDEDGNEQTRIKAQGIDTSFLVATLTAAIQELKATVDAQAARIAALEA
jgi:hypothetical protein